jgi:hypothetical protein
MPNTLGENFEIASELSTVASAKIQAALRCLDDNTSTKIDLSNPVAGGNSVTFTLVEGEMVDLQDCCGLRNVIIDGTTLTA